MVIELLGVATNLGDKDILCRGLVAALFFGNATLVVAGSAWAEPDRVVGRCGGERHGHRESAVGEWNRAHRPTVGGRDRGDD